MGVFCSRPNPYRGKAVIGRLSSASANFEEDLMMGYVLDELPLFVRKVISSGNIFCRSLPRTTI